MGEPEGDIESAWFRVNQSIYAYVPYDSDADTLSLSFSLSPSLYLSFSLSISLLLSLSPSLSLYLSLCPPLSLSLSHTHTNTHTHTHLEGADPKLHAEKTGGA